MENDSTLAAAAWAQELTVLMVRVKVVRVKVVKVVRAAVMASKVKMVY